MKNGYMKTICIFLLVAGPFCVLAQSPLAPAIPKWDPGKSMVMPGPTVLFPDTAFETGRVWLGGTPGEFGSGGVMLGRSPEGFGSGSALAVQGDRVVRQLAPDGMPCVVPNMRRVEPMPIDRRGNADKMVRPGRRVLRIF